MSLHMVIKLKWYSMIITVYHKLIRSDHYYGSFLGYVGVVQSKSDTCIPFYWNWFLFSISFLIWFVQPSAPHLIEMSSPVHPLILLLYAAEFPSFHHKIFPVDLCYIWAQERIMGIVWDFIRDKGKYLMSVSLWKIFHLKILPLASLESVLPSLILPAKQCHFSGLLRNVSRMNLSQVPIAYFIK